jgi:hypothetical protein
MSPGYNLDDYVPVNERLEQFRRDHPTWGLVCKLRFEGDAILARAEITDETGRVIAVGHAEEIRGQSLVNRTSAVENAETSAWGRALACLGYEVKRGVVSREEMEKVSRAEERAQKDGAPRPGNVTQLPAPTADDVARHPANGPRLPRDQAIAARAEQLGLSEDERMDAIERVTDGRTRSGKELRAGEGSLVFAEMEAMAKAKKSG